MSSVRPPQSNITKNPFPGGNVPFHFNKFPQFLHHPRTGDKRHCAQTASHCTGGTSSRLPFQRWEPQSTAENDEFPLRQLRLVWLSPDWPCGLIGTFQHVECFNFQRNWRTSKCAKLLGFLLIFVYCFIKCLSLRVLFESKN